jgi:hypothetical protein
MEIHILAFWAISSFSLEPIYQIYDDITQKATIKILTDPLSAVYSRWYRLLATQAARAC